MATLSSHLLNATNGTHASGVKVIINQINSVRAQDEWTKARHQTLNDNIIRTYNIQHKQILSAIKFREPEKAASLMKEHLEIARLSLTRAAGT